MPATLFFSAAVFAQAYYSKVEYNKKKQDAFAIDYTYSPEAVENAIVTKMEKLGYRTKEEKGLFNKDKGFRIYKNAFISEISENSMDYILKVERKSRRDKDEAVLYLLLQKDGNNARATFNASDEERVKVFLNNLLPEVEAADLELQIKAQEDVVARAEKKLKSLEDDKTDMEKKIKKLEDDIKKNIKDQEDTQKDIENQKQNLENLRSKRIMGRT